MDDLPKICVAGYSFDELRELFECTIQYGDFYDVLGQEIARTNPSFLLEHLQEFEGSRLRGAVFGLGHVPLSFKARAVAALVTMLGMSSCPYVLNDATASLRHLKAESAYDSVVGLAQHESDIVRASVLEFVHAIKGEESIAFLEPFTRDPAPFVREAVVDVLMHIGSERAIEMLKEMANSDTDDEVRKEAQECYALLLRDEPSNPTA